MNKLIKKVFKKHKITDWTAKEDIYEYTHTIVFTVYNDFNLNFRKDIRDIIGAAWRVKIIRGENMMSDIRTKIASEYKLPVSMLFGEQQGIAGEKLEKNDIVYKDKNNIFHKVKG